MQELVLLPHSKDAVRSITGLVPFCVELACSLCFCMGSFWVLWLSPAKWSYNELVTPVTLSAIGKWV